VGDSGVYDDEVRLLQFLEHLGLLSHWFVKVMYSNNSVEFYPLLFSIYAYIESNLYMQTNPIYCE
jgi:hypothetical protein